MQTVGATAPPPIQGTVPVVVDVNASELDPLVATGEVAEVYEDVPVPPTLQDSGPLVRAPQARALCTRQRATPSPTN